MIEMYFVDEVDLAMGGGTVIETETSGIVNVTGNLTGASDSIDEMMKDGQNAMTVIGQWSRGRKISLLAVLNRASLPVRGAAQFRHLARQVLLETSPKVKINQTRIPLANLLLQPLFHLLETLVEIQNDPKSRYREQKPLESRLRPRDHHHHLHPRFLLLGQ